ncbi:MAG: SDR family oxidoreductase [Paracoccaceae bacterium]|jgi:NAD(P)-dependent dehydrogenase (short-subunit alcohol dehydrogenase family)|nr:MAG: SDR family NAD(P)-dependent oxidoreductase [Alphaproteobacteria bacterium]|tara:strand:+ start:1328 stop:2035 length:708 start_codon:yes stop_codon:yes gene_type:complete
MEIENKKALVFGGTSGIGLAACEQLIDKGAEVIAISRDPSKANSVKHNRLSFESCDVRIEDEVKQIFEKYAPFDILVSAATGGSRAAGPFLEMDMLGFKSSFDKLWGYANIVRFGTNYLSSDGTIVLVSGAPARRMKPGQIALSAVGGAVENLVRGVAKEIAPKRINSVSPGLIDTPMFSQEGEDRKIFLNSMTEANTIKRAGKPEEVAKGIIFVIENEFVTGTTVDVDGGWINS